MAKFTTRVLLNGYPTAEDFENLHKAMKKRGFSRIITGEGEKRFWLPNAEYNRVEEVTRDKVLADAKAAAATVSSKYEILVTEGTRSWDGLKPATAAEAVTS